jgi:hypothetical protein
MLLILQRHHHNIMGVRRQCGCKQTGVKWPNKSTISCRSLGEKRDVLTT